MLYIQVRRAHRRVSGPCLYRRRIHTASQLRTGDWHDGSIFWQRRDIEEYLYISLGKMTGLDAASSSVQLTDESISLGIDAAKLKVGGAPSDQRPGHLRYLSQIRRGLKARAYDCRDPTAEIGSGMKFKTTMRWATMHPDCGREREDQIAVFVTSYPQPMGGGDAVCDRLCGRRHRLRRYSPALTWNRVRVGRDCCASWRGAHRAPVVVSLIPQQAGCISIRPVIVFETLEPQSLEESVLRGCHFFFGLNDVEHVHVVLPFFATTVTLTFLPGVAPET